MFRSLKAPLIALLVAVAFACYVLGPARFRKEKVAVPGRPAPNGAARIAGLVPQQRFVADESKQAAPRKARRPAGDDERYSSALDEIQEMARRAKLRLLAGQPDDAEVRAIRSGLPKLRQLEAEVGASFQATGQFIHEQGLPAVMAQRNLAAEVEFTARSAELARLLEAVAAADDRSQRAARAAAVEKVAAFFDAHHQGPPVQPIDPNRLPFRAASRPVRPPAMSSDQLPAAMSAQAAPVDANLAPTEDVQITQPIKDLAASLGNNPVQIFNWVRNNVIWLPTYGSVQGSAVTLATRRGNAFDTSSLLIALYRSAGIPARYAYGTIEVAADRMSNWAGGISTLSAQQLMGQGGIPSVAIRSDGGIGSLRLEHVWVEAFVDFVPSRGAINKAPDTWVQMDPSFKQYRLAAPIDLKAAIPVDVLNTARAAAAPAIVDAARSSITGIGQLDTWAEKMAEDIALKYGVAPDLSLFTGAGTLVVDEGAVLAGSVPNKIVARTATWSELPDSLRHKVSMTLYGGSDLDRALGGPLMTYQVSLPAIAGRRLGVTWVPASDADAAALASFRGAFGGSMPVYLVQVQPSIRIDDTEVARGPSATMGSLQGWDVNLVEPGFPGEAHTYNVAAGDEMVFGIDAQGISQDVIHQRFQQRPSDTAAENLFTVALYYWGQYDTLVQSAAAARNAAVQRLPSIGLFSAPLRVGYFFGMPRSGYYSSRQMDVAHSLFALIDKGGGDRADFQRSIGLIGSLLEGRTFDGLFNRAIGTGVSAVQLLREANEQQIPIFQVTAGNYATVAPQLQLGAEIQGAIANAVAAGKTVLVSQRAPSHGNWSGVGYIVEDPATGAAAYLINGGLNGGADDPCDPERRPEPVRVPVLEIVFALALILLIILILIMLPEIVIAMGEILAAAGPVLARLAIALGLAAAPLPAMAAGGGGPGPGEGMLPPGNCTPEQYATLVAAKVATCDSPPACRGTDCATLTQALTRLQGCVAARETLMVTCFAGGDRRHIDELDAAMRAVANCACRVARHCL